MAKVKVWNDNVHPHKETFKGDPISIKAGGFIVMEEDEAYDFRGRFTPPVLGVDGDHRPEGFKMIRIEKMTAEDSAEEPKIDTLRCVACNYRGSNAEDVAEHAKATHAHNQVVDEVAEKEIQARKKSKAS